jgi:putative glutamine amidotransferase
MASRDPAKNPIVGIPCDRRQVGLHPFHMAGEKYVAAVRGGSGALPLLIPVLQPPLAIGDILAAVDGLLFTGSPSNVAPHRYGGHDARDASLLDEARDGTTIPLLHAAIERGVPVFCLCRGFQELNVALGGTLHQHLEELPNHIDHREDKNAPVGEQYGPAHEVTVVPGGLLAKISGEKTFRVNSLHSQGIDRLAPGLKAEATAPDGTIEAVSMPKARGFLLAVQWHPEWRFADNAVSRALFAAFGDAVRAHARAGDAGARKATEPAL